MWVILRVHMGEELLGQVCTCVGRGVCSCRRAGSARGPASMMSTLVRLSCWLVVLRVPGTLLSHVRADVLEQLSGWLKMMSAIYLI